VRIRARSPRPTAWSTRVVRGVGANANGVSLIGEFNGWTGNDAPMRCLAPQVCGSCSGPDSSRRPLQVPVHGADGAVTDRADPFAFATEVPRIPHRGFSRAITPGQTPTG